MAKKSKATQWVIIILVAVCAVMLFLIYDTKDERGPAEEVGKSIDETVDKLKHGNEGSAEKAGREVGEKIDETVNKIKQ